MILFLLYKHTMKEIKILTFKSSQGHNTFRFIYFLVNTKSITKLYRACYVPDTIISFTPSQHPEAIMSSGNESEV